MVGVQYHRVPDTAQQQGSGSNFGVWAECEEQEGQTETMQRDNAATCALVNL